MSGDVRTADVSGNWAGECLVCPFPSPSCVLCMLKNAIIDSVRAWRAVRHNKEYAAKLEKKLARQQRLKGPAPEATKPLPKSNPFAVCSSSSSSSLVA